MKDDQDVHGFKHIMTFVDYLNYVYVLLLLLWIVLLLSWTKFYEFCVFCNIVVKNRNRKICTIKNRTTWFSTCKNRTQWFRFYPNSCTWTISLTFSQTGINFVILCLNLLHREHSSLRPFLYRIDFQRQWRTKQKYCYFLQ